MNLINEIRHPEAITGEELDNYLATGWYRMAQSIFSSDIISFNGHLHTLHWLRISIPKMTFGKSQRKIVEKNRDLNVAIKPPVITPEIEELYALYKASVDFKVSPTVASYLLDDADNNIYDSYFIEVRDDKKLIAVGVFDAGVNSIAGILNIYHPEYKSRSLGKFLMLLKINIATQTDKEWYYLGYIANGYPKFDYKLYPDVNATEVYDSAGKEWVPFSWPLSHGIWTPGMIDDLEKKIKELMESNT